MVACYLYQLKESGDSPVSSPMDWLQQVAQLPVTQLRPATRSCVAQAMLFYPKPRGCLQRAGVGHGARRPLLG